MIVILLLSITTNLTGQTDVYEDYIHSKSSAWLTERSLENEKYYTNDLNIDVHHYDLTIIPSLSSVWLEGRVCIGLTVLADGIDSLVLDLAPELKIDSFSAPITNTKHSARQLILELSSPAYLGDQLNLCLHFSGVPALLNDIKGLHYKIENENDPLVVSLSTPYLAHQWWPCKDGPEDKADSISVEIVIPGKTPNGKKLHAVSNGLLKSVNQISTDLVAYKWKHNYPIVPYYIMVAIAPYATFSEVYTSATGHTFPLEYFVFEDQLESSQSGVRDLPAVLTFFESIFGPYPFNEEKYGMTQLGFYGGIENQTNSIMNRMTPDYFRVTVHELAHMWFGDMITCSDWHHAWLNEAFASYAECLWEEQANGPEAYHQCLENKRYLSAGTIYLQADNDPFGIFKTIIYYKGAWLLHMLRHVVGSDLFFEIIKNYAQDPALQYGNASTTDFIDHVSQVYSLDLTTFFNQWLYHEYFPILEYNFEQDDAGQTAILISQIQQEEFPTAPIFEMPIDVKLNFSDGTDSLVVVYLSDIHTEQSISTNKAINSIEVDPENWVLCKKIFNPGLTAIQVLPDKALTVFPNPFRQNQVIRILAHDLSGYSEIEFRDIHGKVMHSGEIQADPDTNKYMLSTVDYSPGTYFIILKSAKKAPEVLQVICTP